jgi:hypothetical protein
MSRKPLARHSMGGLLVLVLLVAAATPAPAQTHANVGQTLARALQTHA